MEKKNSKLLFAVVVTFLRQVLTSARTSGKRKKDITKLRFDLPNDSPFLEGDLFVLTIFFNFRFMSKYVRLRCVKKLRS